MSKLNLQNTGFEPAAPSEHRVDVLGPIAVVGLVFLVFRLGLSVAEFAYATPTAVAVAAGVAIGWVCLRIWRRQQSFRQAVELRSKVHALKEQELELRLTEAKMSGKLNSRAKNDIVSGERK